MCGIAGVLDLTHERPVDASVLRAMSQALRHRGPDSSGMAIEHGVGLAARRLAIVDLEAGDQPLYNEDRTLILVCNGEIFNAPELTAQYLGRHRLSTRSDCEPLVHLYEEMGDRLLDRLEGQFAFALYDAGNRRLLLARDPFGVAPLFYAVRDGLLIFASEIKALLKHPAIRAELDLVGLDQIVCFPGLVSPRTMFKGISALPPGHCLVCEDGKVSVRCYWDIEYSSGAEPARLSEADYTARLKGLFLASVRRRLRADVPVGLYISGGLDSSLVAAAAHDLANGARIRSFSVAFDDRRVSEEKYQRLLAARIESDHREIPFGQADIFERFARMIRHAERPVKETYNTCALALSEATREAGMKVVLGGEGADEFFAGYPGYRFDAFRPHGPRQVPVSDEERRQREILWGDPGIAYERNYAAFGRQRLALYSEGLRETISRDGALSHRLVDPEKLRGRHVLHQRSYLDFRLRLADHLLGDHGDHMLMANGVEGRYPFLDRGLIEFAAGIPPDLKLHGFEEKYILKRMAKGWIPDAIVAREKFGFYSVSSPALLAGHPEWTGDLLSPERIRRDGIFCPQAVEALRIRFAKPDFRLDPRYEDDTLLIVLSFNLFRDLFLGG
ncbi:MAG TPA: asparagine synthase (glutamine-hydrolyzing) [Rhizomicrobium sp.]|nr:asparagine synthase (glutamine-hydrolyzing) [Rhizomicrobium sp.]